MVPRFVIDVKNNASVNKKINMWNIITLNPAKNLDLFSIYNNINKYWLTSNNRKLY